MSAREELAALLGKHYGTSAAGDDYLWAMADIIMEKGWVKPRTITTLEELDAAIEAAFEDARHLVLSDRRGRPWIIWADEDGDEQVNSWPQEDDPERLSLGHIELPATIVHEGTL